MNTHVDISPCRRPEPVHGPGAGWLRGLGGNCADARPIRSVADLPPGQPAPSPSPSSEVLITRWRRDGASVDVDRVSDDDFALLMIAVSPTDATIRIDDVIVHDGRLSAGSFQLVAPGHSISASFRRPADFVRLYIPRQMFFELTAGTAFARLEPRLKARPLHDHVVEQLALSLVNSTGGDHPIDRHFLDGIGAALLARAGAVLAMKHGGCAGWEGLVPWRLRRVVNFIESNLDEPLSLADMAQAAGLSRMHFAAQFRLATGFRPHAYLTRRRIERAQELLRNTTVPLVEIALSVGFQTQAHFTTIFRQLSGEPPGQWRQRQAAMAERPFAMRCSKQHCGGHLISQRAWLAFPQRAGCDSKTSRSAEDQEQACTCLGDR